MNRNIRKTKCNSLVTRKVLRNDFLGTCGEMSKLTFNIFIAWSDYVISRKTEIEIIFVIDIGPLLPTLFVRIGRRLCHPKKDRYFGRMLW